MLNYGIIVSGSTLKRWHLNCIRRLHQSKLAQLRCVVNDVGPARAIAAGTGLYSAVSSQRRVDLDELYSLVPDLARYDLSLTGPQAWERDGRRMEMHFFLLFGQERCGLALAGAAPYGVWYFAHSDLTRFSTSAPGFWEVHRDHDVTGAFLLQLRADGSAGVPLKSGYLPTRRDSFEQNVESTLDASTKWPLHVCWDITHGAAGYFEAPTIAKPQVHYGEPSAMQIANMRLVERRHRAAKYVREKFCSIEWTIARMRESPAEFIGAERFANVRYLFARSPSGYFADPCVVTHDSRSYLFCERYHTESHTGTVAVSELDGTGSSTPQTAIEEPHHLSYPHVFEHDGAIYCIPESGGIRKVCLYRCTAFPSAWEYVQTLIDDFEAADSTIVRYGDRWWLFCTSSESDAKGSYSHLYVWHADDLFGNWMPHVRNPVKIDARSARPAGPFFTHEGALYRPAQDCSRSYGGAVRINRVDKLTQSDFEETVVGTIRPPRSMYTRGLHTLSAAGDWCVVDVQRYAFDPTNARYACTQAIKRGLLRLGVSEGTLLWFKRKMRSTEATAMRTPQPSKSE